MTDPFNPHAPCVLGLEWRPTIEFEGLVHGLDNNVAGFWLPATATEPVEKLAFVLTEPMADTRGFLVEVYDASSLGGQVLTTEEFVTGSTWSSTNMTAIGAGSLEAALADDPPTWVPGTYTFPSGTVINIPDDSFVRTGDGRSGMAFFKFTGLIGAIPSTAVVQSVQLQFYAQTLKGVSPGQPATIIRPLVMRDAVVDASQEGNLYVGPGVVEGTGTWTVDPSTGQPWELADVEKFDATDISGNSVGFLFPTAGSLELFTACYSARLVVTYTDPDPRVAVGTFDNRVAGVGYQLATMAEPDGTPDWPKVAGTDYLVLVRRYPDDGRVMKLRALGYNTPGDRALAPQPLVGTTVEFNEAHWPSAAEPVRTNALAAVLVVSGSASVDSQPYASADGDQEWISLAGVDPNCFWSQISANDPGEQDLTAAAGGDYQYLRMIVRAAGNSYPDGDLIVTVKDRADDSTVLGPLTLEPFYTLLAPFDAWQLVEYVFPAAATVAPGTQLYVELTSVADRSNGWHVQALSSVSQLPVNAPPTGTDDITYGGTVDTAHWRSVLIARDGVDYAITLSTLPPTITGLAAVVSATDCTDSVEVTWDAPASLDCGTVFGGYELERYADTAPEWVPVATVWDAATLTWTDLEAPRNATVSYRIRQRRLDGAPSLWSDVAEVLTTDGCCGYRLSSNEAGISLWYDDLGHRVYRITDHTTFVEYEAQDFAAGFQELQQRPDVIDIELMVAAEGATDGTPVAAAPGGRDVFAPALELMGAQRQADGTLLVLSYLAVADETGHVWYGTVKPNEAVREEPGGLYTLKVTLTQTAGRPIPVEVGTAP